MFHSLPRSGMSLPPEQRGGVARHAPADILGWRAGGVAWRLEGVPQATQVPRLLQVLERPWRTLEGLGKVSLSAGPLASS